MAFHSNGTTVSVGNTEGIIQFVDLEKITDPPVILEGHGNLGINFLDTITSPAIEDVNLTLQGFY